MSHADWRHILYFWGQISFIYKFFTYKNERFGWKFVSDISSQRYIQYPPYLLGKTSFSNFPLCKIHITETPLVRSIL